MLGSGWLHLRWLPRLRLDTRRRYEITVLGDCVGTDVGLFVRCPPVSNGPFALAPPFSCQIKLLAMVMAAASEAF